MASDLAESRFKLESADTTNNVMRDYHQAMQSKREELLQELPTTTGLKPVYAGSYSTVPIYCWRGNTWRLAVHHLTSIIVGVDVYDIETKILL